MERNEEYIMTFLKQAMLGQSVKMSDKYAIFVQCIKLADGDMLSGGRFVADKFALKRDERINYIKDVLSKDEYNYNRSRISEIASNCFWDANKQQEKIINGHPRMFNSFGLAQKLYNMAYKYFYVFYNELPEQVKNKFKFTNCDCPIDSVILFRLGREEVKWTNLNTNEYDTIQSAIDIEIERSEWKNQMGRLIYDFKWIN